MDKHYPCDVPSGSLKKPSSLNDLPAECTFVRLALVSVHPCLGRDVPRIVIRIENSGLAQILSAI